MGIWYKMFHVYCTKVKKITEDIDEETYFRSSPGPLSKKYISVSFDEQHFTYYGSEKLKDFLFKLQFFAHMNTSLTDIREGHTIHCSIFGQPISFYLSESQVRSVYTPGKKMIRGKQILFSVLENGKRKMTAYADIMPALEDYHSKELGQAMLNALNTSIGVAETSEGLIERIIRPASLFILLTHIPEAAIPFGETINEFQRAVHYNNTPSNRTRITGIKRKTGRIPMADKIVRSKLRDVAEGKVTFKEAFSVENFVIRGKEGTSKGRSWVLKDEAGDLTGDLSDSDDECSTLQRLPVGQKYQSYPNQAFFPES